VKTELPKLEDFFEGLQKSWDKANRLIYIAKKAMKKQFNKKRRNLQEPKVRDNMWLKAKNIQSN